MDKDGNKFILKMKLMIYLYLFMLYVNFLLI